MSHIPMTAADLRHLADTSAPISDEERLQAVGEITALRQKLREAAQALEDLLAATPFDLVAHLKRQMTFSAHTFGPGLRTKGVADHIRKELIEVEAAPHDVNEWIDIVILGLDGAWRTGATAEQIVASLVCKQDKNEGRTWPDWRTADPDKAIEHDRSGEVAHAAMG